MKNDTHCRKHRFKDPTIAESVESWFVQPGEGLLVNSKNKTHDGYNEKRAWEG